MSGGARCEGYREAGLALKCPENFQEAAEVQTSRIQTPRSQTCNVLYRLTCDLFIRSPRRAQTPACEEKSSPDPPAVPNGVSVASQTPVPTPPPAPRAEPRARPPDSPGSVRQMLQDEMFKLVQVSASATNGGGYP